MVKGAKYARKKAKPKYGHKPKALRISSFSLAEIQAAMLAGAKVFTQGIGIEWGVQKISPNNAPWTNATAGAKDNTEAIRMLTAKNASVGAQAKRFGDAASVEEGTTGLVWVRNTITKSVYPISQLAYNLHMKGAHAGILALTSKPTVRIAPLVTA